MRYDEQTIFIFNDKNIDLNIYLQKIQNF